MRDFLLPRSTPYSAKTSEDAVIYRLIDPLPPVRTALASL